jgi:Tfp pilus assembly protein PilN
MNLDSGVSLGQLILAISVMLATGGVAWGGLMQRVKTLEKEVEALSGFAATLARLDERTHNMAQDISEIKGSWVLSDPPRYTEVSRPLDKPRGK